MAGRRRTDDAAAPWSRSTGPGDEHPTTPGRSRTDRRPAGFPDVADDTGRRRPEGTSGRARPPLPPVRPVAAAPQTTMAPFTPSPHPHPEDDAAAWTPSASADTPAPARPAGARSAPPVAAPPVLGGEPPVVERRRAPRRPPGATADRDPRSARREDVRAMPAGIAPPPPVERRRVPPRDLPGEPDPLAAWEARTAEPRPVGARAVSARPAPSRPVAAPPAAPAAPPYGDWTKPSRSGPPSDTGNQVPVVDEPAGTGEQAEERSSRAAELFPRLQASAEALDRTERAPSTGEDLTSVTGTFGGRAALRAERQAAEAARRRSGRKGGATAVRTDDAGPRLSPRRAATGLVAVAVVALGVLGVYSFVSPSTRSASTPATAAPSTAPAPAPAPAVSDLPPLATGEIAPSVAPVPAAPAAHLPVTVLNETAVNGLAARVAGAIKAGGWPTTDVGAYTAKDIGSTTVYFTQGDDAQRASAVALVDQFPQLHGPVPRFFDVPGQATPGLVVVTTGDWKP